MKNYVDRENRICVTVAGDEASAQSVLAGLGISDTEGYVLRIVADEAGVDEKKFIFEDSLDDRVIEICKGVALSQFQPEEGLHLTDIRYDRINGSDALILTMSDGSKQYAPGIKDLYDALELQFAPVLEPINDGVFHTVDIEYAAALIRKLEETWE